MQQLIEDGSRTRRIWTLVGGAALVAVVGLTAAHLAGYPPFAGQTPTGAPPNETPRAAAIGGPMISTQVLEHPTRARHPTHLTVSVSGASRGDDVLQPRLAVTDIRREPARRAQAPIARLQAPMAAQRVIISDPPPARFARPHGLLTPAELCAQTDRPERCLRGIFRERRRDLEDWGPGDRGRGHAWGRRWDRDEDDGDEGDDD